jgi:hypothetical protein
LNRANRGCKPKPPKIPSPQLRSAIAQVGGKQALTGRTDFDIELSNPCARLIANAIIYYNAAILPAAADRSTRRAATRKPGR